MFKNKLSLVIFLLVLPFSFCWATEVEANSDTIQFYPVISTTFPVFAGAGLGVEFYNKVDLNVQYGITPQPYYNVIGDVAASQSGNSSYKDVINAAFQNNSLIKAETKYFFNTAKSGWLVGLGYYSLTSSGAADIDKVLAASTGQSYTTLKNLLIALGKPTTVDMTAQISILEAIGGYSWEISNNLVLRTTFGVAKVLSNTVSLKTGLANFEASQTGYSLMRQSESDIQGIINQYGLSPTLGLNLSYLF